MAKVVIFGLEDFASLAHYYFKNDSEHEVVAFSVHAEYLPEVKTFEGLPIVAFEEVEKHYPPEEYSFFAPMSHRKMNRLRREIYEQCKAKGYTLVSYVSSKATVFPEAEIGENCFILEDNTIQPFTPIGNNVVMWSGNHIGHHGRVHDHVLFTSHVVLSGHCEVQPHCVFGVNATIRDFTKLAEGTFVAMGACLTKDTEEWGIYKGVPAKLQEKRSNELEF